MVGSEKLDKANFRQSEPWAALAQTALSRRRAFIPAAMTPTTNSFPTHFVNEALQDTLR